MYLWLMVVVDHLLRRAVSVLLFSCPENTLEDTQLTCVCPAQAQAPLQWPVLCVSRDCVACACRL